MKVLIFAMLTILVVVTAKKGKKKPDYMKCHAPRAMGSSGKKSGYTYVADTDTCELFKYKSKKCLKVLKNAFKSKEDCEKTCKINIVPVCMQVPRTFGKMCPEETDSYDVPTWSYNYVKKRCELFNYAGCYGNHNRFSTKQDCLNNCPEMCDGWKTFVRDPCVDVMCRAFPKAICRQDNCSETRDHYFTIFGYEVNCHMTPPPS